MESKNAHRIALSIYFFLTGLIFASWASRIPTIKTFFNLNEAELGTILVAMPISSLIGLPISGWLVSKFDSRVPLLVAFIFLMGSLVLIGFAQTPFLLVLAISSFAFFMRIVNISKNTQSITLQKEFKKGIIGGLHGLWSTGGLLGVGISTVMVKLNIGIQHHLLYISIFTSIITVITYRFLLKNDKSPTGNKLIIGKPDTTILLLGILLFLAAICEGGMFDWSGVYFKEVIKEEIFTYGYLLFMVCMAISRFFSDKIIDRLGTNKTYLLSATVVTIGVLIAILLPTFWPALLGFCFIGLGTAAIFPMTYALAGTSKKYSPGMAISIISTYGILGMFIGPPLIGYLAHAFGLRNAFYVFVVIGILIIVVSRIFFLNQSKNQA